MASTIKRFDRGGRFRPQALRKQMMRDEASYVCNSCGEEIVVPLDISQGTHQEYVEDCPVCCHPNVIHVDLDEEGEPNIWSDSD